MGYWEPWDTGSHGILGAMGYWEPRDTGSHGILGAMGYWEPWDTGSLGILGVVGVLVFDVHWPTIGTTGNGCRGLASDTDSYNACKYMYMYV